MTARDAETESVDSYTLVHQIMRESYLLDLEEVRAKAEKVRYCNEGRKALRAYLTALRQFKANVISAARKGGVDLCRGNKKDLSVLIKLFQRYAHAYEMGELEHDLCIPARVPATNVDSIALLDAAIARWEEQLASFGDDAQLANVELQIVLQKQQQTLQTMSNVSKMVHDNLMAVIRKMGG